MTREILFKAKQKNWRELPKEEWWVEGDFMEYAGTAQIWVKTNNGTWNYIVDLETLCQYTGRTDKNGKRIWENSVVKTSTWITGKVIWHDETAGFCLLPENENDDFLLLSYWIEEYEIEVIGNIFDNTELL